MKDIFRILLFLALPYLVVAQQYDYAKLLGGVAGDAFVHGIKTDGTGNVYVKGTYTGAQEIEGNLYRTSGKDAFISKFDNTGSLIWFKNVGFTEAEDGSFNPGGITVDANSNIYITGSFSGNATIGGTSLTNQGQQDIYIIKYDLDGTFIWASSFGGAGDDFGLTISVDASENVYIGGSTKSDPINFGAQGWLPTGAVSKAAYWAKIDSDGATFTGWIDFELGNTTTGVYAMDLDNASGDLFFGGQISSNIFYRSVKLIDGTQNWAQDLLPQAFSSTVLGLKSISGDLIITGYFSNADIDFPSSFAPITLTNIGQKDIFLASLLSSSGLTNWAISYGGKEDEEGIGVDVNTSGSDNILLTGNYFGADLVIFGGVPLPQPGPGGSPFIAVFDDSPNPIAATSIQSDEFVATSIELNEVDASIYLSGYYIENATLQTTSLNQKSYTSYVGSFKESNLTEQWFSTSHKGQAIVEYMVVDNNDNLFLGGYFDGTVDVMGNTIISSEITTDPALPRNDLFVAKMKPDETIEWIVVAGGMDADTLVGISYDGQGSVYLNARFTNVATIAGVVPDVMGKVIVKLDQNGNLVYAQQFTLPANSDITAIQGDNDIGADSLYMAGYYNGVADFQNNPTTPSANTDVFIVALDGNGTVLLVTDHGGDTDEKIADMHKVPGGDLHITGWSNSWTDLTFGTLDLSFNSTYGDEIFIVSFDEALDAITGFTDGEFADQDAQLIAVDGLGNIIIAGELFDDGVFGGIALDAETSYNSFYIASYSDISGNINFAGEINEWGGVSGSLTDLVGDAAGNAFLGGILIGDLNFGDLSGSAPLLSASGQSDGFLAKYNNVGNIDFVEAFGGDYVVGAEAFEGYDYGLAMALNSSDELWYSGTLAIRSETFGSFTLQPASSETPGEFAGMDSYLLRFGPGAPGCASPPTANAGADKIWCENSDIFLSGSFSGATSITWSTNGDGTFSFANTSLSNWYIPGTTDIANGIVTLTLTTDDPDGAGPCIAASDDVVFTIERISLMDAGPDQTVCQGDAIQLSGAILGDLVPIQWWTNGADGTFDDANILTPVYTPGPNDILNGSFELQIESSPPVCTEESDNIIITISQPIIAVDQVASLNVSETTVIDITNGATIGPGDIITTTLLTQPQKGTTVINNDGSIDYTASAGTVGDDTFDYEIRNQCDLFSIAKITITIINVPPVVDVPPSTILVGGIVTRNILADITDDNDNIDFSTLKIITQPSSGAPASLDAGGNLTVDYAGLKFVGTDQLTIEVCDLDGLCTTQIIFIEVEPPSVVVYNAVSPNGDDKHDYLEIENAEFFPNNQVKIMNRWGDIVYEINGYDNDANKFTGVANKGGNGELPTGTYYYSIVIVQNDGSETTLKGFFTLRR